MKSILDNKKGRSIFDSQKNKSTHKYKHLKCSNCNEMGHIIRFCDEPINSYGIILYMKTTSNKIKYVMICRKHTIGYIEFIRGNYKIDNIKYLETIFNIMTTNELHNLETLDFKQLWNKLWNYKHNFNLEFKKSKHKFYDLKNGKYRITLDKLIHTRKEKYTTPEWGFPKGRKNINETNKDASIREVYEETNITPANYKFTCNVKKEDIVYSELYKAFNNKIYNLSYYLAELDNTVNISIDFNKHQENEISNIGLFTVDEIKKMIRPYYKEKIKLIKNVDTYIRTHLLD